MLTKFVEGAREVEMDAVGKEGRVCANAFPQVSHFFFSFVCFCFFVFLSFHQFLSVTTLKRSQVRIYSFLKIMSVCSTV